MGSQHDRLLDSETPESLPANAATAVVPRTIVVSDVRLYREGLALGLEGNVAVQVAGTASTFEGALALLFNNSATVVLLDAGMPNALDIARRLLRAEPSVRVVAVAVADEGPDVVACAEAGLSGYVPRDGSLHDTVNAIIDATHNELHCSPRISAALFKRLSAPGVTLEPADSSTLTPRESDVLQLIDRGLSNKQIAQRLQISAATVKNHVHNILEKLHVERRSEAAAQMRSQRTVKVPLTSRRVAASSTTMNQTV